ncbi:MFS transporter [Pigmentiphaga sp. H8]|uniref:MFS transporter n=1 Tax=Pigmentiphaga sp. H8 TaxID=2488560 RepID=UPI001EDE8F6C|nr:MFS transporter [Pigmentiphaga sp. H8]
MPAPTPRQDAPAPEQPHDAPLDDRGVAVFCTLAILSHMALTGGRVTVSLGALAQGASSFTVGVLMALFALVPMLLSVHTGRWVDHIGARRPLRIGVSLLIAGNLLPFIVPDTQVLFLSSCLTGIGCMVCQIAVQNVMGIHATPDRRILNFSRLSLSLSISGFGGPLVAGLSIDHLGVRWAFGVLLLCQLGALGLLLRQQHRLPRAASNTRPASREQVSDLLASPILRRVLVATALLSGAWDLNSFMVPIFGASIGLSATTIGVILSAFAVATFVIRMLLPWIQRRLAPWTLLRTAMFTASAVYVLYPFFRDVPILIMLAFLLGLALGSGQPSLLALLHAHAPPGRAAEALGLRMATINGGQFVLPLAFGSLSALAGLGLPFWTVAACLLAGGIFNRAPKRPVAARRSEAN